MENARGVELGWGWAFIDLAALGRNTVGSYALTLLPVVLLPVMFVVLSFGTMFLLVSRHLLSQEVARTAVVGATFAAVFAMGVTLAWRVERGHRRPWMSLISPDLTLDWRRL